MKMNTREKVLIIILAAIVILLGGFKLLIEPAQKDLSLKNTEYQTALDDKAKADLNVLRAKGIDKENSDLEKKITITEAPFFPELKSDKIQLFFNDIITRSNVIYTSFIITTPKPSQVLNPPSGLLQLGYPAKEASDAIYSINNKLPQPTAIPANPESKEATANVEEKAIDIMEMSTVSIQFKGNLAQTNVLIDAIKTSKRLARISSINISVDNEGITTVTVSAECYGVKKFTSVDPLLKDTLAK
jgi:hypothetical protein